jgi:hypothetical protein
MIPMFRNKYNVSRKNLEHFYCFKVKTCKLYKRKSFYAILCKVSVQLLWLEFSAWRHWNKTLYVGTFNGKGRDIGLEHAENHQARLLFFRWIL